MLTFYKAIWRHTGRRQIVLIILSAIVAALAAVPLEYQKQIINGLSRGLDTWALLRLGLEMLAAILLSLGLKWALGYRSGLVGEWAIRKLRTTVYERSNALEKSGKSKLEKGTLTNMISTEAETVGKIVGDAVAEPVLQFGTLISVIGYIAATQPSLGLILILIVVPQLVILVLTQSRVNQLVSERVLILRHSINTVTESDMTALKQSVLDDFDAIYETRRKIFAWKLSTKFILSAINGFGLVAILAVGGWLVIEGRSDIGIVVAATVGLGRIEQPWRLLTAFYRSLSAIGVQYELMQSLFADLEEGRDSETAVKSAKH